MFEAAKMKRWMPDHKGRSRRKGVPSVPGWHRVAFFACALLPLATMLPGCAAKRNYWGHPATDLSSLSAGTPRSRVDTLLGPPDRQDESNGTRQAWYLYDRGFVGTLEDTSAGEKIVWAPIMAWGELVSLGLVELMILCQAPCQKGLLEVRYDQEDRLLQSTEHIPPDTHPAVKGCMTRPVRNDLAVCQGVRERRRPSTLSEIGRLAMTPTYYRYAVSSASLRSVVATRFELLGFGCRAMSTARAGLPVTHTPWRSTCRPAPVTSAHGIGHHEEDVKMKKLISHFWHGVTLSAFFVLTGCATHDGWKTRTTPNDFIDGTVVLAEVILSTSRKQVIKGDGILEGWRDTLLAAGYKDQGIVDGSEVTLWTYCYGHNSGVWFFYGFCGIGEV